MLKAIWGLAALVEKLFDFFERIHATKRQAREAKTQAKADNYDKLQRALKARGVARERLNAGELPYDKYRRDE